MKTRKVGKIVSLLVAIVLVATIMIPAASVLADSTKYANVKWTEVGSFTELQQAIENANDANLEAGKTAYIRLTADILCKRPYFNNDEENGGSTNWAKMYLYSVTRIYQNRKIQEKKVNLWSTLNLGDSYSGVQKNYQNQYDVAWLLAQTGSPFDVNDVNSVFYGMTVDDFNNGFVVDTNNQDYVGMGKKAPGSGCQGVDSSYDEKIGNEYSERELVVEAGANVTIDLNGKTLKGSDYDPYSSTPKYQMSVLKVDAGGNLTVVDLAGNGQICGGTGNVYFDESVAEDNSARARAAIFNDDWTVVDAGSWGVWSHSDGKYRVWYRSHSVWAENAKESRGGGVYVCDGGTFTLESGKIARNCAWMGTDGEIFDTNKNMEAKGGGIYVEAGGTVNMYGGEICNNAARAYNKKSDVNDAHAYGGAIYLEEAADGKVATFNMTGGKIAENAAYAETLSSNNSKSARSYGAGIYVGTGSVCNIMGSADAEGPTTEAMLASFPQITNNSCGALIRKTSQDKPEIVVQGAGIYCDGTLNMKKVLVSSNDFSEFSIDLSNNNVSTVGQDVVHVDRDAETGLPLYIYDYNDDGTAKTKITRLDDRFTENLELSTEKVAHETSGIFGVARGNGDQKITSDGAGVYLGTNAKMNVGERTWITGNYDLVTTGHKAFDNTRNFARYWDKTANGGAGGYVYTGKYTEGAGNGYTWSDTSDDVYLPEGVTMYKGGSLFESRIGVNYYDMVDKEGDVSVGATGRASNRVIVKTSSDLDYNLWGATSSSPVISDIQFFSLNDNNKNYERDNYADLPERETADIAGTTCELLDLTLTPDGKNLPSWGERTNYRVAVIDTDEFTSEQGQYRKNYLSPYQGYVDFDTVYPAGRFFYTTQVRYDAGSAYTAYNKETYFKADPTKDPTTAAIANKNVIFPQRAYQIDTTVSQLSESEQRAKFMDYKVVYDDSGFGSDAAPVLRFGKSDRQMYVTYNFDEADKTYYGENTNNQSLNEAIDIDTLITSKSIFKIINTAEDGSSFTFYGANKPTGTLKFNKIVPDYKAYKSSSVLADRIANRKSELTSITKTNGNEDKDLYFKGWSFYTSYGYGPEIVTLSNKDELQSINVDATKTTGSSLDYRGTFTADLSKIINQNVNAQPCPSMTATWYTKEELAEARKKVSNVMFQTVQRDNGDGTTTNLLRAVAIAGSQYLDFDEVGFVISTTNATPTIEGGYDYVVKSRVYEKLGVNKTAGAAKTYYDVDKLLGGSYSGKQSVTIEDATWTFTEGSQFAANVTTGVNGKAGYKDAGLFYTNIVITDANKDTVYFVTPYAKMGNTYYYGESRAACYADAPTA